jgi:glycosyltransferase involved in cell wall biosynthesis
MRVVICWSQISGYMAACWRELAKRPGIELFVMAFDSRGGTHAAFADDVAAGFECKLLTPEQTLDAKLIGSTVRDKHPQILVVPGWLHRPYVELATELSKAGVKIVVGMDTPMLMGRRAQAKQWVNRFRVGHFLKKADRVVVAGERAWQYARFLGVAEEQLRRGVYGIDFKAFAPLRARRACLPGGWPRRFIYSGRYMDFKGIDVMLAAYERYRATCAPGDGGANGAWSLSCCGIGPKAGAIAAHAGSGVTDHGFVQPSAMPEMLVEHGAFVLPSLFDPWPLVIVEAAAAGLPILCTEACGSAVEVVRSHYNGIVVGSGDVSALAAGMRWMHEHADRLAEMGARGQELAAPYAAEVWATRWEEILQSKSSNRPARRDRLET